MEASHSKKVYKSEKTDIFNDEYKQLKARVLALKEQYINGCIKSSIRNNLTMCPSANSKKVNFILNISKMKRMVNYLRLECKMKL